jgi:hypothetical protein
MKCPACCNPLTELQVGAVVVDACQDGCGGIWFDAFELQRVDEPQETAGEHLVNIRRRPDVQVDYSRKRACPRCDSIKLRRHPFGPKSSVEVDHCPGCGGYWLDAGELERIRQEKCTASHPGSERSGQLSAEVIRYLYRMRDEMRSTQ